MTDTLYRLKAIPLPIQAPSELDYFLASGVTFACAPEVYYLHRTALARGLQFVPCEGMQGGGYYRDARGAMLFVIV